MKKITKKQRIAIYKEAYERYDEIRKGHSNFLCDVLSIILEQHFGGKISFYEVPKILPEFAKMKPKNPNGTTTWFLYEEVEPRREILKKLSEL